MALASVQNYLSGRRIEGVPLQVDPESCENRLADPRLCQMDHSSCAKWKRCEATPVP